MAEEKKNFEDYKYEKNHVNLFFIFDKKGDKINTIKNISIVLFVIILLLSQLYGEVGFLNNKLDKINDINKGFIWMDSFEINLYGLSMLIVIIIVYLIVIKLSKRILYCKLVNKENRNMSLDINTDYAGYIKLLLSPDSYYSEYYKEKLKNRFYQYKSNLKNNSCYYTEESEKHGIDLESWNQIKVERKFFIEWSNWFNCIITIVICLLSFVIIYISNNKYIVEFFLILTIYRCYSRSFEIGLAFYKDVVNKTAKIINNKSEAIDYILGFKSSIIRSNSRLSLAIHSLIELVFLYSNIYFINSLISNAFNPMLTPFNSLMFSASLGVFNISFDYTKIFLQSLLHVSQVVISVILILLSIAQYLGDNDELSKKDKNLYLEVEKLKKFVK